MDRYNYHPRNPIFDKPYNPKGGSGILKAFIWVTIGQNDTVVEKLLAYSWTDTVNGKEVEVEKPIIPHASALEEDIYNSLKDELKFTTLNFIKI